MFVLNSVIFMLQYRHSFLYQRSIVSGEVIVWWRHAAQDPNRREKNYSFTPWLVSYLSLCPASLSAVPWLSVLCVSVFYDGSPVSLISAVQCVGEPPLGPRSLLVLDDSELYSERRAGVSYPATMFSVVVTRRSCLLVSAYKNMFDFALEKLYENGLQ